MGLRQHRAENMPSYRRANYEFMRQAKRAELLGLGAWIDTYMPRGEVSRTDLYRAAYRFEDALDHVEASLKASDNVEQERV